VGSWNHFGMLIVAGWLQVEVDQRDAYLTVANQFTRQARAATGCLEFTQAPDPIVPGRIVILERWESEADLLAFRESGSDQDPVVMPEVVGADVQQYAVSRIEPA
jgi:quinol monooxygenase YgiN